MQERLVNGATDGKKDNTDKTHKAAVFCAGDVINDIFADVCGGCDRGSSRCLECRVMVAKSLIDRLARDIDRMYLAKCEEVNMLKELAERATMECINKSYELDHMIYEEEEALRKRNERLAKRQTILKDIHEGG